MPVPVTECTTCVRECARRSPAHRTNCLFVCNLIEQPSAPLGQSRRLAQHRAVAMSLHASRQALHSNAQWGPLLPRCIGKSCSIVIQAQSRQAQSAAVGEPVQQQQAKQQLLQPQDAYPLVDIRTQTKYVYQIFRYMKSIWQHRQHNWGLGPPSQQT